MEDWSKSIVEAIETTVSDMEKFFTDVTEELNEILNELTKISEEITDEVQNKILPELDEYINDIFEPIIDIYFDLDLGLNLDIDTEDEHFDPFVTYIQPTETEHPACRGCQHYHGQVYGGNLLVCGMHPMGAEAETCPDWEGE
ncbi:MULTISPECIES: hypothetical protein [Planktothrix]|jgi:hypothetical protein|uniref:Uncharacterized protein n=3 Tax=Planktothrix TaxID=54304 RepID=A0A4P5ZWB7_PLAAG|nr:MULTISPECIES: hypothetical protein [Planktothrix]AQY61039.1 hypothetical protein [Planktothrix agardhii No758]CAD5977719.1 hypothetical protein NO108_04637 [Planktothrix rubescens]MCB8758518.1 hypothetical protein [Planktothrix agardhii 1813]CAC5344957.1 conserved hypothetical protein [Planktothrix rubescens NIVA-CYA 18]CAD0229223.1 conserved hypothetical protein [Planktothrix agardhii]